MNAVLRLARKAPAPPSPAPPSPERAKLAATIAAAAVAREEIAAMERALPAAREAVARARAAVERADAGVADASDAAIAGAIALASGKQPAPATSIREARDAQRDANDELANALAAEGEIKRRLQAAQTEATQPWVMDRPRNAAMAVIRAEAAEAARAIGERVAELQRELTQTGAIFVWLCETGALSLNATSYNETVRPADPELAQARSRMFSPPFTWNELIAQTPGAAVWEATVAALMADAAAPLPDA